MSLSFYLISAMYLLASCGEVPANLSAGMSSVRDSLDINSATAVLDTLEYEKRMRVLCHDDSSGLWPARSSFPLPGAILPFHRIVAYYGNLYSKQMGILGELPSDQMLRLLMHECKKWEKADSNFPVKPALHYIALTAQTTGSKMNLRMPFHQIDKILSLAKKIDAIVFLDLQLGWSNIKEELPRLEKYLILPNVHIGIDPEFAMQQGHIPGTRIGSLDSRQVNEAIKYLRNLVQKHNIPPKVLVIHRFTKNMLTGASRITPSPEVQVVINMDGFGERELKKNTYKRYIYPEPVQFSGFKIFYKNDARRDPEGVMGPEEILKLTPRPVYIQYQ